MKDRLEILFGYIDNTFSHNSELAFTHDFFHVDIWYNILYVTQKEPSFVSVNEFLKQYNKVLELIHNNQKNPHYLSIVLVKTKDSFANNCIYKNTNIQRKIV